MHGPWHWIWKIVSRKLDASQRYGALAFAGYALLVGVSRKRVVGQATGVEKAADRMLGTVAANVAAIAGGCDIIRVHDVLECVESAKMADAIFRQSAKGEGPADG